MADGSKKFFFDLNDFSVEALEAARKARENAPPVFSTKQLEEAQEKGYRQGVEDGKTETLAGIERDTVLTLQALTGAFERLAKAEEQRAAKMVDQTTLLTFQVIEKLMPLLLQEHGANHIISFIHKTVTEHVKLGRLKVNIHPEKRGVIESKLVALTEKDPKLEAIELIDEPTLDPQACRVAWAQGGADWDPNTVAQAIFGLFKTHLPEALDQEQKTPHTEPE